APAGVAFFVLMLPVLGFLLQESIEWNMPPNLTVGLPVVACLFLFTIAVGIHSLINGAGPLALAEGHMARTLDAIIEAFRQTEGLERQAQAFASARDDLVHITARLVPALVVATTLVVAWANLLTAMPILRLRQLPAPGFVRLNTWSPPERLVWVAIVGLAFLLMPGMGLRIVGANVVVVLFPVYFFAGMAVMSYYMEKKAVPKGLRTLVYMLVMVQQILLVVVVAVGFFDLWADFRKINRRAPAE
ncbi:MAG: DUF2232 domain-containing protein, partial [Desulfatibacillaceae bacterium]